MRLVRVVQTPGPNTSQSLQMTGEAHSCIHCICNFLGNILEFLSLVILKQLIAK